MTSTCSTQVPAAPVPLAARAGMVAPFIATDVEFAVAVIDGLPQVLAALGGEATRSCAPPEPTGKLSLTAMLVSVLAEVLLSVIVMRVTAPSDRGPAGLKALIAVSVFVETVPLAAFDAAPLQVAPLLWQTLPAPNVLLMADPFVALVRVIDQNVTTQLPGEKLSGRAGTVPIVRIGVALPVVDEVLRLLHPVPLRLGV